jgi:hypothetical protein
LNTKVLILESSLSESISIFAITTLLDPAIANLSSSIITVSLDLSKVTSISIVRVHLIAKLTVAASPNSTSGVREEPISLSSASIELSVKRRAIIFLPFAIILSSAFLNVIDKSNADLLFAPALTTTSPKPLNLISVAEISVVSNTLPSIFKVALDKTSSKTAPVETKVILVILTSEAEPASILPLYTSKEVFPKTISSFERLVLVIFKVAH